MHFIRKQRERLADEFFSDPKGFKQSLQDLGERWRTQTHRGERIREVDFTTEVGHGAYGAFCEEPVRDYGEKKKDA